MKELFLSLFIVSSVSVTAAVADDVFTYSDPKDGKQYQLHWDYLNCNRKYDDYYMCSQAEAITGCKERGQTLPTFRQLDVAFFALMVAEHQTPSGYFWTSSSSIYENDDRGVIHEGWDAIGPASLQLQSVKKLYFALCISPATVNP